MPRTNKPMTLSDLLVGGGGSGSSGIGGEEAAGLPSTADDNGVVRDMARQASSSNNNGAGGLHKTCHIPTLPNAAAAQALLERVTREFRFIAEERGYNVLSVSELCCCNDGLDFEETSSSSRGNNRKLKKCQDNVLGYNRTVMTSQKKVHSIHLRLRNARNHNRFYDYEDVAGTLAHELAHCEHGPHNDAFFKLMDQFLEEHAVRMASNITTNGGRAAVPSFSGTGQVLGGGGGGSSNAGGGTALGGSGTGRSRLLQPGGSGQTLGAGRKLGGDDAFTQWMTPAEAAAVAALVRRRQEKVHQRMRDSGDGCCGGTAARPIVPDGIIFAASNDDVNKSKANKNADRKRPPKTRDAVRPDENQSPNRPKNKRRQQQQQQQDINNAANGGDIIDLTMSSDDDEDDRKVAASAAATIPNSNKQQKNECWSCTQCTFLNPHSISVCNMCATPKVL